MIVAITQRVEVDPKTNERRDCLDQKWIQFLENCGLTPLSLPNQITAVKRLFDQISIQGIILSGGNSLIPYGGNAPERDETDHFLLEFAIQKEIPLLGVCRGMQVIQHFFGGKLEKILNHINIHHKIFDLEQKEIGVVNSYHQWAIKKVAPGLRGTAFAEDNTVEALCHSQLPIRGIMWHPERNVPFIDKDIEFVRAFFA